MSACESVMVDTLATVVNRTWLVYWRDERRLDRDEKLLVKLRVTTDVRGRGGKGRIAGRLKVASYSIWYSNNGERKVVSTLVQGM